MIDVVASKRTMPTQWVLYDHGGKGTAYPVMQTPYQRLDGREYRSESWIVACNKCGHVWARRYAMDRPLMDNWHFKMRPCKTCGNGSLWDGWNEPWTRSLPPELLIRELLLAADWIDLGCDTHIKLWSYKHYGKLPDANNL